MRRFIYILLLLNISLVFTGCRKDKSSPILYKEPGKNVENLANEEDIDFIIEKVSLSKSYQNIKPEVQIVKKGLETKLLASFGLINSSGIEIEKIKRDGNNINIYVSNQSNILTNQLVVPQALIDINKESIKNLEDFKYYIHNIGYEPIKVKLDANDAINIVNSDYQISTTSLPDIKIENSRRRYYWSLEYFNVFDKSFKKSPIINLSVKIDADSGEIVQAIEEPISSFIDNGLVLDFLANQYILYKKTTLSSQGEGSESLWLYNINNHEKEKLFTSDDKILSASFNNNHDSIALLESRDKNNQLYLIPLNEGKAYKISFKSPINPSIIKWKDRNNIYIVHQDGDFDLISNYNFEDDKLNLLAQTKDKILELDIYKDYFLVLEEDKDEVKRICLSKDLKNSIYSDVGVQGRFINDSQIAYVKNDSQNDSNNLWIYDIEEEKLLDPIQYNISSYTSLSDNTLALVERTENNTHFTLHEYDLSNFTTSHTVNISSDKISLNLYDNMLYINSSLPFDEAEGQIIYSVDISDLSNIQP